MEQNDTKIIEQVLDAAKHAGADSADLVFAKGNGTSVNIRLGALESLESAEDYQLGLRVFVGRKIASVSTGQLDDENIKALAERAVAMAKVAPDDPYARLARKEELATSLPEMDLCDEVVFSADQLEEMARVCEDAARSEPGISNSEGASASYNIGSSWFATSEGFIGQNKRSSYGISAVVLAEQDGAMERDYDYSSAVFAADLEDPLAIGQSAAKRTLSRLGAKKPATGSFPVVFDKRVSRSLAGHIAGAINGQSVARGTSFLKDMMGEIIANDAIHVIDDPLRARAAGSCQFDGEGLAVARRHLIEKGVLQGWLLDLATADQLGLDPTGNARRGLSSPPGPGTSNFMIADGDLSFDELIADIEQGFLVTELMGSSVSLVTGDYSRGASGFWIENGQITWPASEATIAGNLKDMFKQMIPANDSDLRHAMTAPSLRIDAMTVAGS